MWYNPNNSLSQELRVTLILHENLILVKLIQITSGFSSSRGFYQSSTLPDLVWTTENASELTFLSLPWSSDSQYIHCLWSLVKYKSIPSRIFLGLLRQVINNAVGFSFYCSLDLTIYFTLGVFSLNSSHYVTCSTLEIPFLPYLYLLYSSPVGFTQQIATWY